MGGLRHSLPARILVLAPLALMLLLIGCGSSADKITFVSEVDGDAEIYVIDPDSGEATPLTDNHSSDTDPVWSPDGKQIAYVSDESGDLEINVVDRKGELTSRLTNIPGDDLAPLWSPDGGELAFISNQDGNAEVYLMTTDGGRPVRITAEEPDDRMGDWSPDGVWLAFARGGSSDERGLWLRNPDGVNLVHLTTENDFDPVWSPDGKEIVFVRDLEGNLDLFLASRLKDGTWQDEVQLTRLTQHEEDDLAPTWSPNGRVLMFFRESPGADGAPQLWRVDANGRNLRRAPTPGAASDPSWSPLLP